MRTLKLLKSYSQKKCNYLEMNLTLAIFATIWLHDFAEKALCSLKTREIEVNSPNEFLSGLVGQFCLEGFWPNDGTALLEWVFTPFSKCMIISLKLIVKYWNSIDQKRFIENKRNSKTEIWNSMHSKLFLLSENA